MFKNVSIIITRKAKIQTINTNIKNKLNQLHDTPLSTFRQVLEALRGEWRNSTPRFTLTYPSVIT